MVPEEYPPQQPKAESVALAPRAVLRSKARQESIAAALPGKLAAAAEKSSRIMAEDLIRESGHMPPQSGNAHKFLTSLLTSPQPEGFPAEAVRKLLDRIKPNERAEEKPTERWKCSVCGLRSATP